MVEAFYAFYAVATGIVNDVSQETNQFRWKLISKRFKLFWNLYQENWLKKKNLIKWAESSRYKQWSASCIYCEQKKNCNQSSLKLTPAEKFQYWNTPKCVIWCQRYGYLKSKANLYSLFWMRWRIFLTFKPKFISWLKIDWYECDVEH